MQKSIHTVCLTLVYLARFDIAKYSQLHNGKLFVLERNKCQNNIVNIHSRLYMHAMGVMQAQPCTHTHVVAGLTICLFFRR